MFFDARPRVFAGRQVFLISPQVLLQVLLDCTPPSQIPLQVLFVLLLLVFDTSRTPRHPAPGRVWPPIPSSAAFAECSPLPARRRAVVALPPMPSPAPPRAVKCFLSPGRAAPPLHC